MRMPAIIIRERAFLLRLSMAVGLGSGAGVGVEELVGLREGERAVSTREREKRWWVVVRVGRCEA